MMRVALGLVLVAAVGCSSPPRRAEVVSPVMARRVIAPPRDSAGGRAGDDRG